MKNAALNAARRRALLTASQVADQMLVPEARVYRIERGTCRITKREIKLLSRILGVSEASITPQDENSIRK